MTYLLPARCRDFKHFYNSPSPKKASSSWVELESRSSCDQQIRGTINFFCKPMHFDNKAIFNGEPNRPYALPANMEPPYVSRSKALAIWRTGNVFEGPLKFPYHLLVFAGGLKRRHTQTLSLTPLWHLNLGPVGTQATCIGPFD